MHVIVTGASGQLGRELLRQAPNIHEVYGLDRSGLDIGDPQAVRDCVERIQPHAILNAAAYTAVDRAESDAENAYRINSFGAGQLALAAARVGARLIHVSTDFVFDGCHSVPYRPGDPTKPLGIYGLSKREGELAVLAAAPDALIVRTAWVYSSHGQNFVKTMLRVMRERPEVRVVADQVGTPTSATTLARTLWSLLDARPAGGIFHCTDAGVASWYDFACAIRELAQPMCGESLAPVRPIRTQDYPTPAQRPAYSVLDKTATWEVAGNAPHWREALKEVIRELLEQE